MAYDLIMLIALALEYPFRVKDFGILWFGYKGPYLSLYQAVVLAL